MCASRFIIVWKDPLPRDACVIGGVYEMEDDGPGVGIGSWVVWTSRDSGLRPWHCTVLLRGVSLSWPVNNGEGGGK